MSDFLWYAVLLWIDNVSEIGEKAWEYNFFQDYANGAEESDGFWILVSDLG